MTDVIASFRSQSKAFVHFGGGKYESGQPRLAADADLRLNRMSVSYKGR
jgi:hypothetical protein